MEKYFKTIGVLLLTLVLQSCEKETMRYEGEPGNISGIYFLYSSSYTCLLYTSPSPRDRG